MSFVSMELSGVYRDNRADCSPFHLDEFKSVLRKPGEKLAIPLRFAQ